MKRWKSYFYLLGIVVISMASWTLLLRQWPPTTHPLPPISKPGENWTVRPSEPLPGEDTNWLRGTVMSNGLTGEVWKFDDHWIQIK